jgi:hypothetical protein
VVTPRPTPAVEVTASTDRLAALDNRRRLPGCSACSLASIPDWPRIGRSLPSCHRYCTDLQYRHVHIQSQIAERHGYHSGEWPCLCAHPEPDRDAIDSSSMGRYDGALDCPANQRSAALPSPLRVARRPWGELHSTNGVPIRPGVPALHPRTVAAGGLCGPRSRQAEGPHGTALIALGFMAGHFLNCGFLKRAQGR